MGVKADPTKSPSIWDSLYGTVTSAGQNVISDTAGSAGTMAQNWLKKQAKQQLLDPLERDVFRVENAERLNLQADAPTSGQSPITNIPNVKPVLFDYKPKSSGNTAVFYIVGGAVLFMLLSTFMRRGR